MNEEIKKASKNSRFLQWLQKWKPLLDFVGVLAIVAVVVISVIGLWMSYSSIKESRRAIQIASDSLKATEGSIKLQEEEFKLRNRPWVFLKKLPFCWISQ